ALQAAAEATGRIVTVEDHFPEGGLGDAVLAALAEKDEHARVLKLAVREMPRSGKPEELLNAYGIDAEHIGLVRARLDHRTQRCRSRRLAQPLEHDDGRAPQRRLLDAGCRNRPP